MRAAVEAIRLASVLPSPAGPVTVEHRHERGRSIADRAVDHLPRPRDAGMAMGGEQPDREVQRATAEIADKVQRRHGLARRADRVDRARDRDIIDVVPGPVGERTRLARPDERRVGNGGGITWRTWRSQVHTKKKKK